LGLRIDWLSRNFDKGYAYLAFQIAFSIKQFADDCSMKRRASHLVLIA
jgi:hypothetical protein